MKTTILKYITVTFAAGAMLLAGCNDLDQEPTNKFTDKAFWTSPERANMVLNMAYNQMFGHDKIWQDEALSDNLYEQRGNPDTRTIRMGQATPNTGLFRSEWCSRASRPAMSLWISWTRCRAWTPNGSPG